MELTSDFFLPHLCFLGVRCCSAIFFLLLLDTWKAQNSKHKASNDKGARFLQGLLFKHVFCICCLDLLNMHWKSDFCSSFCVDISSPLHRTEQVSRSVRSFEWTRNRLSFRKDLSCKPPIIFCQLTASSKKLSLLLHVAPARSTGRF